MTNPIQAIRGMNDILPPETALWQYVENVLRNVVHSYGFQEIRFPIVEKTELFKRTIGEATDIVEKEMYTFVDRSNENLTLRPEGTASCVRAGVEHGLLYHQIQKLWYMGPYFRYERPQKGRYRQFHQFGAEIYGLEGPDIDAELIMMSARILDQLGLKKYVRLELNSLGSPASRSAYRDELVRYLTAHQDQLDEDSQRRLSTNPLRILDSKNPAMQQLIQNAPKLVNHLDDASQQHFDALQQYLTLVGIEYTINPCLVRGLDYYTKTVFEWVTDELGAQGTVLAGGRYDDLVEQLGGKATPALGFAMGMERTLLLVQHTQPHLQAEPLHAYILSDHPEAFKVGMELAEALRSELPALKVWLHCGGGSLKNQFKKADKSGAQLALILGDQELSSQSISIKSLREDVPQMTVPLQDLVSVLRSKIKDIA